MSRPRTSTRGLFQHRPTILIVDDDEVAVMAVKRALERHNLPNPTLVARDGAEALDILRSGVRRPYIILLDINMPRMSGLELLSAIRTDEALSDSVVFMMTTSDAPRDVEQAYKHHVAGYIQKQDAFRSIGEAVEMLDIYLSLVTLPA